MAIWYQFVSIIYTFFIKGAFISVPTIILGGMFVKNKPAIAYAAAIIKWMLIGGAFLTLLTLAAEFFLSWYSGLEYYQFSNRATGPYWWAYWLMFSFGTFLPLILLFKPLGKKLWFLFTVSVLMNFGWLFERVIIYITSLRRGYIASSWAVFYLSVFRLAGFYRNYCRHYLADFRKSYRKTKGERTLAPSPFIYFAFGIPPFAILKN